MSNSTFNSMCGCLASHGGSERAVRIGGKVVIKESRLAEGAYGEVWKCRLSEGEQLFALKEIRLQSKELREMFEKEVRILVRGQTLRSSWRASPQPTQFASRGTQSLKEKWDASSSSSERSLSSMKSAAASSQGKSISESYWRLPFASKKCTRLASHT